MPPNSGFTWKRYLNPFFKKGTPLKGSPFYLKIDLLSLPKLIRLKSYWVWTKCQNLCNIRQPLLEKQGQCSCNFKQCCYKSSSVLLKKGTFIQWRHLYIHHTFSYRWPEVSTINFRISVSVFWFFIPRSKKADLLLALEYISLDLRGIRYPAGNRYLPGNSSHYLQLADAYVPCKKNLSWILASF